MAVVLASWLTVRRGRLGRKRRAYVVLTDELALVLDTTQTLALAGAVVDVRPDALRLSVRPAGATETTHLFAPSALEYERWAEAVAAGCAWTLDNFYDVETKPIGSGTHGVVRMARPLKERPNVAAWFRLTTGIDDGINQHDRPVSHVCHVRRIVEPASDDGSVVTLDDSPLHDDSYAKPTSETSGRQPKESRQEEHQHPPIDQDSVTFGTATHQQAENELYVVKTISKADGNSATVTSELLAARRYLRHFAIASIVDVFETPTEVHCVSEFVPGPSLHSLLCKDGPMYEFDARRILKATVKAVGYMHSRGVAHWDIRPRNIMLTQRLPPFGPKCVAASRAFISLLCFTQIIFD
jgi:serine/threonine protein kinase